jgi:hypothetical protein
LHFKICACDVCAARIFKNTERYIFSLPLEEKKKKKKKNVLSTRLVKEKYLSEKEKLQE